MRLLPFCLLFLLFHVACKEKPNTLSQPANPSIPDTVTGSFPVTGELPGSAYRKRATAYFAVIQKDTSGFRCIFTEEKEGAKVNIHLPPARDRRTYRQRLAELREILPAAAKDYDFDSLNGISFGRLVLSGDLAVDITRQYRDTFGNDSKVKDYATVSRLLETSRLGADLDSLFAPYGLGVDRVSVEKVFFTTRKDLYAAGEMEADTAQVPDKILDALVWVRLRKK